MLKTIGSLARWLAFYFLPCYVALSLLLGFFMVLATGWTVAFDVSPVLAILCIPAAGLIAASQSIPLSRRE